MDMISETLTDQCRFLNESYFDELYHAFLRAFSDYVMPFDLTEVQFRNHIVLNAVDLDRSVGLFDGGRLIGFTLNGFGPWHGVPTVYDAGTGVFPEYRRRGLSKQMFGMMLPEFEKSGSRQCLLEVITDNYKAVGLYEKLGFETTRTLSLLHCPDEMKFHDDDDDDDGIELRDIDEPDWELLRTFWDGEPSWQNSTDAIDRSRAKKRFIGAFSGDSCLGYIVFSTNVGRVAQLAVDKNHRCCGIGKRLLRALMAETPESYVPQVINIDRSIDSAMSFFRNRGFTKKLSQFEMLRGI
jgi:ribosomal protein S18 acetylase RimI-like enzyme